MVKKRSGFGQYAEKERETRYGFLRSAKGIGDQRFRQLTRHLERRGVNTESQARKHFNSQEFQEAQLHGSIKNAMSGFFKKDQQALQQQRQAALKDRIRGRLGKQPQGRGWAAYSKEDYAQKRLAQERLKTQRAQQTAAKEQTEAAESGEEASDEEKKAARRKWWGKQFSTFPTFRKYGPAAVGGGLSLAGKAMRGTGRAAGKIAGAGNTKVGAPMAIFMWVYLVLVFFDGVQRFAGFPFEALAVYWQDLTLIKGLLTSTPVAAFIILYFVWASRDGTRNEYWLKFFSYLGVLLISAIIISFGPSLLGYFHLLYAAAVYFVLLAPLSSDSRSVTEANLWVGLLLVLDFFGMAFAQELGVIDSILANRLIFPYYLLFFLFYVIPHFRIKLSKPAVVTVVIVSVFYAWALGSDVPKAYANELNLDDERVEQAIETLWGGPVDQVKRIPTVVKNVVNKRIGAATGDYYSAQVDENAQKRLGVFFEDIQFADPAYVEGDAVTVWATVKTQSIDEEFDVRLGCSIPKKGKGELDISYIKGFDTLGQEDISCTFPEDELEIGQHSITLTAEFDFKTLSYLKTYFMEEERVRSFTREGIDPLRQYGIVKTPNAIYTNGPVLIGISTKDPPIEIGDPEVSRPSVGMTIENRWPGKIKNFKNITLYIPEELSLDVNSCNRLFIENPNPEDPQEGFVAYTIADDELKRLKDIKTFQSFRCRLSVEDKDTLLGDTPFATKFIKVTASYVYEITEGITTTIGTPTGFDVKIRPQKPSSAEKLECTVSSTESDIVQIDYQFNVFDSQGNEIASTAKIKRVCGDWRCSAAAPKTIRDKITRDTIVKCSVNAELADGSEDSYVDQVSVKNGPPVIENITFSQLQFNQDVVCTASIRDSDSDSIVVSYQITRELDGETEIAADGEALCELISATDGTLFSCRGTAPAELAVDTANFECEMTPRDLSKRENAVGDVRKVEKVIDLDKTEDVTGAINLAANRHGVPNDIARAVAHIESGGTFKHARDGAIVIGDAGEVGLYQIKPSTANERCKFEGQPVNSNMLRTSIINIDCANQILAFHKQEYDNGVRASDRNKCETEPHKSRYLSYEGWDFALRSWNGWGCPSGTENYVEMVNERAEIIRQNE